MPSEGFSGMRPPACSGLAGGDVKFGLNERERSDTAVMDAAAKTKADAMDNGMESGGRNGR